MAEITLSWQDRADIVKAVATEADHNLSRTHPEAYASQVAGIVDTILNRVASPQYPNTVRGVLNQYGQFSAINGPARDYKVWGSVEKIPDNIVPKGLSHVTNEWINNRIDGRPSSVGGELNYANKKYSEGQRWLNDLDGPEFGAGDSIHTHGTAKGGKPVEAVVRGDFYNGEGIKLPPGTIPEVMTIVDLNKPSSRIAQRVNAMWDAAPPIPEPRSAGTAARTMAAFRVPRPVTKPASIAAQQEELAAKSRPRPVEEAEQARQRAALANNAPSYAGQERAGSPPQRLPMIGPSEAGGIDPVGIMPSAAELTRLRDGDPNARPGADIALSAERQRVTPMLDAEGNIYTYHIPEPTLTTVQRGLGSLTPDAVATTPPNAPLRGTPGSHGMVGQEAASDPRGSTASVVQSTAPRRDIPQRLVGEEGAAARPAPPDVTTRREIPQRMVGEDRNPPPADRPTTTRIRNPDQSTTAGNVAMPADARPQVADSLVSAAQSTQRRKVLEQNGSSYVGQDGDRSASAQTAAPVPRDRPASLRRDPVGIMPTQESFRDEMGLPNYPNQIPSIAEAEARQPTGGAKGPGIAERVNTALDRTAAPAEAKSAADVPKYITTKERVPIERPGGQKGLQPSTQYTDGKVPLGAVNHGARSRDAVAQAEAGRKAAEEIQYRTITKTTLNPEWVEQQSGTPSQPGKSTTPKTAPRPAGSTPVKDEREPSLLEKTREAAGLPKEGLGKGLLVQMREGLGLPGEGLGPGIMRTLGNALSLKQTDAYRAAPVGANLGTAANGGQLIKGKNGVMNSITQKSEAWKSMTGQEDRYTDRGDGSFVDPSGGVYYERHLK